MYRFRVTETRLAQLPFGSPKLVERSRPRLRLFVSLTVNGHLRASAVHSGRVAHRTRGTNTSPARTPDSLENRRENSDQRRRGVPVPKRGRLVVARRFNGGKAKKRPLPLCRRPARSEAERTADHGEYVL